MEKLQQFLVEEQEVLADFLLDMEGAEGNKEYSRAAALWSMQSARVGAIKDALMLLSHSVYEDSAQHLQEMRVCDEMSPSTRESSFIQRRVKKEQKKCCICSTTTDLYSVTSESGEYLVKTYCGKHLPE